MKFNSQVATSRSQSERLLSLGLKKETADMWHYKDSDGWKVSPIEDILDETAYMDYGIPAWSLHRLIELRYGANWISVAPTIYINRAYDDFIDAIEDAIKEGYFNKEYLV